MKRLSLFQVILYGVTVSLAAIAATIHFGPFALVIIAFLIFADYHIGLCLPKGSLSLRVNLSGIGITAASGKISGSVFAKGKGNLYVRVKTKPHNPNSAQQAAVRASFRTNSQAWRALTPAQRSAWNAAAINFPRKNKLGNTIVLSGAGLYNSLNANLFSIGASIIASPPAPTTVLTPLGVTITNAAGIVTAAWTSGVVPASTAWEVYATPGLSAGKYFVKSQFRLVTTFPAGTATAAGVAIFTTPYNAKFGVQAVGTKMFMYMKAVGTLTGLTSKSNIASTILT
jgi:hypothetical protein